MVRIITKDDSMAQVELESGERVLISCTKREIALFKLSFFGFVPSTKIWSGSADSYLTQVYTTGAHTLFALDPIGYLIQSVAKYKSIDDIKKHFNK